MGTAGINEGHKLVLCHPLRQPFQLAVTQQAGGVQVPVAGNVGQESKGVKALNDITTTQH